MADTVVSLTVYYDEASNSYSLSEPHPPQLKEGYRQHAVRWTRRIQRVPIR